MASSCISWRYPGTLPVDKRSEPQTRALYAYYLSAHDTEYKKQLQSLQKLRKKRNAVVDPVAEIMVMRELPQPRPTYFLTRGAYDAPANRVQPGTPESLPPFSADWPRNRLGLANWLTAPKHPLTARVTVNRFWQSLFGRGLVTTPEDFGNQGDLPSHPALLDWLAKSFIDSGWNVKALHKTIVMSAVYRQRSGVAPDVRAADPQNLLLARGSAFRLPAEMIRDNALSVGGLLVEKLGGPSVKPFQPAGLWKEKSGKTYSRDAGDGSHRRSLYTYWKRTSPPPRVLSGLSLSRRMPHPTDVRSCRRSPKRCACRPG